MLKRAVPGLDPHGKFRFESFTVLAEYTGALKEFDPENLSYNHHGAKPQAINLEAAYNFNIQQIPGSFALGYTRSFQVLALNIPQQSYAATVNVFLWKNMFESLELRHSMNYPSSDVASGQGKYFIDNSRHSIKSAILRFGVYF